MSVPDALKLHGKSEVIFVDVRDSGDIAKSGTVTGGVRLQCGCHGAGGQFALAGKTLKEMGYTKVFDICGFSEWKDAGGPVEPH
jgi:rhodanese-related sulfurtransferase